MTENNPEETAKDLFTSDRDEILNKQLPRMDGWFDVTGGDIRIDIDIDELNKGQAYLAYLTAVFVADLADERETPYVSHSEADDFLGWRKGDGRTSEQYASEYSDLLETEDGEKAISPYRLEEVINSLEEEFNNG